MLGEQWPAFNEVAGQRIALKAVGDVDQHMQDFSGHSEIVGDAAFILLLFVGVLFVSL
jgi:hypothetical protein